MLDLLIGTGEFAGAPGASALLAGGGFLSHHVSVKRARTFFWKDILLGSPWPIQHHIDDLRNHVAGALDDDGIADADVSAFAQLLAVATDALDVILIMQRRVLHHDAADGD